MPYGDLHPCDVGKVERKGRTRDEVDMVVLGLAVALLYGLEQCIGRHSVGEQVPDDRRATLEKEQSSVDEVHHDRLVVDRVDGEAVAVTVILHSGGH